MTYSIAIVHAEEDYHEILQSFDSYDDADAKYDEWSERLPHAWIEIIGGK